MDERLESLCLRLAGPGDPLAEPGPMHDLAARIAGDVRAGREDLSDELDSLEDRLLAAGYAAGLSSARSPYAPVPGLGDGHPPLTVLACPAGRCTRVEPPADPPPLCAVLRRPLVRVRLGP
ncbi:hypothetical protein [Mangrovihabitans endophyticus]|uniref:Uncharacterized protein n=1 Tax=Mangrovihabitans endophyticus TaxID=1751298 RepID=A0A8J3FPB9_9ACTN|nr:hypothetical protein [Mangrovihabitans endophyticus]GGK88747.1 hypothetical protein GCM10012284_23500 [Mangrovihabitans endophyticus]